MEDDIGTSRDQRISVPASLQPQEGLLQDGCVRLSVPVVLVETKSVIRKDKMTIGSTNVPELIAAEANMERL